MRGVVAFAALALSACGSTGGLKPRAGGSLPVSPYGARERPTVADLQTPSVQARPGRSGELLRKSEPRRTDEFDLPPP